MGTMFPGEGSRQLLVRSRRFLRAAANLVFPLSCAVCRSGLSPHAKIHVCPACLEGLETAGGSNGRTVGQNFERLFAPYRHAGILKELIHRWKYGGEAYLGRTLGHLLASYARGMRREIRADRITAVPLHSARLREREFNQAEVLAAAAADALGAPLLRNGLVRAHVRRPQVGLARSERQSNIRGAFRAGAPAETAGHRILLVDDVLTTGATCEEASRVLRKAGALGVEILTLAHADIRER